MFERFTDRARKSMALANREAHRLNHAAIDTEHVLLGLVEEGSGVGFHALQSLGVDPSKTSLEIEKLVKPGPNVVGDGKLPQTPQVKDAIKYAVEESRSLHHDYVGTEHMLLGLLRVPEGVAAQVLVNLGLTLDQVRKAVLDLLIT